jgi:hypothetical protein
MTAMMGNSAGNWVIAKAWASKYFILSLFKIEALKEP